MELNELKPSLQLRQKRRDKRMDEEVIECYRRGMWTKKGKGHLRNVYRLGVENLNVHEGIKAVHTGGRRYPSDNLQPLIRYLRSHVGKHWDSVHSKLCASLDTSTVTGQHVMDHLKDLVHTKVVKVNGRLITHDGRAPRDITDNWRFRVPEFYVHPRSGVLMQLKPKRKPRGPNYRV